MKFKIKAARKIAGPETLQQDLIERGIKAGICRIRISGKGNCYDNAPMESFRGTLKNQLVYHEHYRTRDQTIREITEYIEILYNRQRRQKSPVTYHLLHM